MPVLINLLDPVQVTHGQRLLRGETPAGESSTTIQFSCLNLDVVLEAISAKRHIELFEQVSQLPDAEWGNKNALKLIDDIRLCDHHRFVLRFVYCNLKESTQEAIRKAAHEASVVCSFMGNKRDEYTALVLPPASTPSKPPVAYAPPKTSSFNRYNQVSRLPEFSMQAVRLPKFSTRAETLVRDLNHVLPLRCAVESLKDCVAELAEARKVERDKLSLVLFEITSNSDISTTEEFLLTFNNVLVRLEQIEKKWSRTFIAMPTQEELELIENEREAARRELRRLMVYREQIVNVICDSSSSNKEANLKLAVNKGIIKVKEYLHKHHNPSLSSRFERFLIEHVLPHWLAALLFVLLAPLLAPSQVKDEDKRVLMKQSERRAKELIQQASDVNVEFKSEDLDNELSKLLLLAQFNSHNELMNIVDYAQSAHDSNAFDEEHNELNHTLLLNGPSLQQLDELESNRLLIRDTLLPKVFALKAEYKEVYVEVKLREVDILKEMDIGRKQELKDLVQSKQSELDELLAKRDEVHKQVQAACVDKDDEALVHFPEYLHSVIFAWEQDNENPRVSQFHRAKSLLLQNNLLLSHDPAQFDHNHDILPASLRELLDRHHPRVRFAVLRGTNERFLWKHMPMTSAGGGDRMEQEIKKLRRALLLSRRVNHASILPCLGGLVVDGNIWLQFPFQMGGDLEHWLKQRPSRSFYRKLDVLCQICDALAVLHSKEVYHRDVKPQNICLDSLEDWATPTLIDFELSKELNKQSTKTHTAVGSPGFVAPEVSTLNFAKASNEDFARCDVYSFAATALVVLAMDCDSMPSPHDDILRVLEQHKKVFDLQPGLYAVLHSALQHVPAKRTTMHALRLVFCERACCLNINCEAQLNFHSGVRCPQGDHFICRDDLDAYVKNECKSTQTGNVLCPAQPCSTTECFTSHTLGLPNVELVANAKLRVLLHNNTRELESKFDQRMRDKLAADMVEQLQQQIFADILTKRCPECKQDFDEHTACCALTCFRCGIQFCAFCLGGSAANAHAHVRNCEENPTRGEVFCSKGDYQAQQNRRKSRMLKEFLAKLDSDTCNKVMLNHEGIFNFLNGLDTTQRGGFIDANRFVQLKRQFTT